MTQFFVGAVDVNVLLAFVFGVVFIVTMLVFAVIIPNPEPFAQWVFITVLALAAAGVGAVIPGMLDIDLGYAKAGGAIALFAIVFGTKPTIIGAIAKVEYPPTSPMPVIRSYLDLVDKGEIEAALDQLDPLAPGSNKEDRDSLIAIFQNSKNIIGSIEERVQIGMNSLTSPAGHPIGGYKYFSFKIKSRTGLCYLETISVRGQNKFEWKVFEHNVSPHPIPC